MSYITARLGYDLPWLLDDKYNPVGFVKPNGEQVLFGGSVVFQAPRAADFNVLPIDNGAVIPVNTALTATLLAASALDVNFMCEIRNVAAVATVLSAGAGTTLIVAGSPAASISISQEGSSIILLGSGTANRFFASKVGS